jgi:uncharacterized protein (TIGR00369 family)
MSDKTRGFSHAPDPDNPGWVRWQFNDPDRFNEIVLGTTLARAEDDNHARVRILPHRRLTNAADNVHGGATLALIDVSLFATVQLLRGIDGAGSVTLGIDTQFIGPGDPVRPLDAVVEILRETGRLVFLRGLVVQDDDLVASFAASIRKPTRR